MPNAHDETEELVVRGPVLVPMGWLVSIFGAAGTAIMASFWIGIAASSMSTKLEAQASEITRLRDWRTIVSNDFGDIHTKVTRMETIMEIEFPDSAARAKREH